MADLGEPGDLVGEDPRAPFFQVVHQASCTSATQFFYFVLGGDNLLESSRS